MKRNFMCWVLQLYVGPYKVRSKACFEGKLIKNPIEILCHACALMRFWADLYADGAKEALIEGVNTMLKIDVKLFTKASERKRDIRRIQEENKHDEGDLRDLRVKT